MKQTNTNQICGKTIRKSGMFCSCLKPDNHIGVCVNTPFVLDEYGHKITPRVKNKSKIFYEESEGEFYQVTETNKIIQIDWIEKMSSQDILDFNVRWKSLKVGKDKNRTHCLREFTNDYILIYPYQAGKPFALELATKEHIQKEIEICRKWGTSTKYYDELLTCV